jgi:threonyl-tRNA synthetase
MLHRALFGSLERFIGILIEHYAGKLPLWLSPVQAVILPISQDFNNYAKKVFEQLKKAGINCEVDLKKHKIDYKIREHSLAKVPILLICGKKELDANTITIRRLSSEKQETMNLDKFVQYISSQNKVSLN